MSLLNRIHGRRVAPARERGAALLILATILVLGMSYLAVKGLGSLVNRGAIDRERSGESLRAAKQALIGYVARIATQSGENNPGRLPCPEPAAYIGDTASEGVAAPGPGATTCATIGRLPWRTLGVEQLKDASGEPLWYVASPGWALQDASTLLTINSDSQGQLSVDGQANAAVALIIAPGPPISVSASAGCSARNQLRPGISPTIDLRDYLECENATSPADSSYVTAGPAGSFNDQVVVVTAAEVLNAIEGAVAARIEREIVPALKGVYADSKWGTSSANPVFPFAAPFANPGTSNYRGAAGTYQGLLPFNYSASCNPATDPRCITTLINWGTPTSGASSGSGWLWATPTCGVAGATSYCYQYYWQTSGLTMGLEFSDPANNVAMGMRTFSTATHTGTLYYQNPSTGSWSTVAAALSRQFNSNGSVSFRVTGSVPGFSQWTYYYFIANRPTFTDHTILSATDTTTGWFVRNQWYRAVYYALAPNFAAGGSGSCSGTSCLQIANITPTNSQRSILVLAGRSLSGTARPNASLADYLEFGNADNGVQTNLTFERQPVSFVSDAANKRPFNDRIVVLDQN